MMDGIGLTRLHQVPPALHLQPVAVPELLLVGWQRLERVCCDNILDAGQPRRVRIRGVHHALDKHLACHIIRFSFPIYLLME